MADRLPSAFFDGVDQAAWLPDSKIKIQTAFNLVVDFRPDEQSQLGNTNSDAAGGKDFRRPATDESSLSVTMVLSEASEV